MRSTTTPANSPWLRVRLSKPAQQERLFVQTAACSPAVDLLADFMV